MAANIFTKPDLVKALENKGIYVTDTRAEALASYICANYLEYVQTGFRHDGKGITFAQAYELIYGERLTLKRCG